MLDLAFSPDRASAQPVYRQLGGFLRALIEADRLPAGTKLPATRELAVALGLARNTVSLAYDELVTMGILTAHVGQGTFVAQRERAGTARAGTAAAHRSFVWSSLFALRTRGLALPEGLRPPRPATPIRFDFRGGQIDLGSLPAADLRRAFAGVLARQLRALAGYGDPLGWPPLRREIARYLVGRGIGCGPEDVAVVNGAQQAIDLAARVLVDPGDTVAMEQPGYFGASMAFLACQANLVGVGVDAEGLRTDELARVLKSRRVKLVYVTPAAQSPTGVVLGATRRRALLDLADEHQTPIFEDDYDSELRYEGAPIAALKTIDVAGQVIYAGTFSKVLFPGLRVGYLVAARPLLEKLALARFNADGGTSAVGQAALAELLAGGGLERHLRRVRKVYGERLAAMREALAASMPAGTSWTAPRGGHVIWLTLPDGADAERLLQAAHAAGVVYTPGTAFHWDGRGEEHIMLSFANVTPSAIREGIGVLGDLVRKFTTPTRRRAAR